MVHSVIMTLRKLIRKPIFIGIILLNLVVIFYFLYGYKTAEEKFFQENYLQIGASQLTGGSAAAACHLPIDVSPFDSSIQSYFETHDKKVQCSDENTFRPLTFIDENGGILRQNHSHYSCDYQLLRKHSNNDIDIDYGPKTRLDPLKGLKLDQLENYILVKCDEESYENIHFWFNPTRRHNVERKPSVVILVIESLSRLNYLRYLNATRHILEQRLGNTFYLNGLNKMADNSFPNMVPMLTGKRLYSGELSEFNENYGPYDDWPFIWKDYAKSGYVTALVEDYPKFTLFNYESNGFIKAKPTDFYPRPYWTQLFSDQKKIMLSFFPFNISPCYKSRVAKVDIFLDQLGHLLRQTHSVGLPLFAFSFYIELTHNNFNKAQTIDSHIAQFLDKSLPYLDDTILILMGDHGNRFGSILQTTIGRIEERMPLFALHLPKSLTNKYPHLSRNLNTNQRRLSTWLDVYEMLKDIVNANFTERPTEQTPKRAYSLWHEPIPLDRTCEAALIPELYCACDRRITLNHESDPLAHSSSDALVAHLNSMLTGSATECENLVLKKILRAELIFPSNSTAKARGFRQKIEITLLVSPSEAIFRSRLYRTAHQLDWKVDRDQVTRINEYGDQPRCIRQRNLKPFCFCRQRPNSSTPSDYTESTSRQN